jgi:phosphatidylglycerophosphate synthase
MPANVLGKLKTVCQVLTIVVLIVADTYIEPWERFGRFLLWVTVAISLVSAVNYLWIFLRVGSSSRKLTNLRNEEIEYDDQREERKKVVS